MEHSSDNPGGKERIGSSDEGGSLPSPAEAQPKEQYGKGLPMTVESGTLMLVNPDNGGLEKLDDATWDRTIVIPAGRTVNVKFDIPYNLGEYGETASNLADMNKLPAFADKRMKRIKDLKFLDYIERYEIDCPNSWMDK